MDEQDYDSLLSEVKKRHVDLVRNSRELEALRREFLKISREYVKKTDKILLDILLEEEKMILTVPEKNTKVMHVYSKHKDGSTRLDIIRNSDNLPGNHMEILL